MKKKVKNKKVVRKKDLAKEKSIEELKTKSKKLSKEITTLQIINESDIAMDFATKAYKKFNKTIKSIILFGSTMKGTQTTDSDIDLIIIIDDVSIKWDQEIIAWYREELDKILKNNPYKKSLHINTIKLSTWWEDLMRGDPVVINVLRYGEAIIDLAGFFEPLKFLLIHGKIRSTPEAVYTSLQRAPLHLANSKAAELNAIEGLYWAMVDSAHSALIAANVLPPSPEHIPADLNENFVKTGKLNQKYVAWYRDLLILHKKISHRRITELKGVEIDEWQDKAEEFVKVMADLVNEIIK
ncbi:hypothetical protein HN832_03730 [archaeon]|jgi:predicted nucleotidyltransferase/uncharacterized protein (UPF0332 family)|nr:hypothetical protein [archaeon]MBT4373495.1 hypothetical protein [archaeon]MBT4531943.1 hypothetical protein [archaeon]MBT7001610.1 hypothetical protein [archaeon]MBT7282498.1 hypothetical protein [archaeon]